MIQRIQTIWLLLAALTICCLLFLPMVITNEASTNYYITATGLYQKIADTTKQLESNLALLISTIAAALISFINIFNFKNRAIQKRIIYINILLIIGLAVWFAQFAQQIPGGLVNANYFVGLILFVLAVIFCSLAIRGINHDDRLIRSADRLR